MCRNINCVFLRPYATLLLLLLLFWFVVRLAGSTWLESNMNLQLGHIHNQINKQSNTESTYMNDEESESWDWTTEYWTELNWQRNLINNRNAIARNYGAAAAAAALKICVICMCLCAMNAFLFFFVVYLGNLARSFADNAHLWTSCTTIDDVDALQSSFITYELVNAQEYRVLNSHCIVCENCVFALFWARKDAIIATFNRDSSIIISKTD